VNGQASPLLSVVWRPPAVDGMPVDFSDAGSGRQARENLRATAEETLGERPGVPVDLQAVEGHPAAVLTEATRRADLLVVGSHGQGAFAGCCPVRSSPLRAPCHVPGSRRPGRQPLTPRDAGSPRLGAGLEAVGSVPSDVDSHRDEQGRGEREDPVGRASGSLRVCRRRLLRPALRPRPGRSVLADCQGPWPPALPGS